MAQQKETEQLLTHIRESNALGLQRAFEEVCKDFGLVEENEETLGCGRTHIEILNSCGERIPCFFEVLLHQKGDQIYFRLRIIDAKKPQTVDLQRLIDFHFPNSIHPVEEIAFTGARLEKGYGFPKDTLVSQSLVIVDDHKLYNIKKLGLGSALLKMREQAKIFFARLFKEKLQVKKIYTIMSDMTEGAETNWTTRRIKEMLQGYHYDRDNFHFFKTEGI